MTRLWRADFAPETILLQRSANALFILPENGEIAAVNGDRIEAVRANLPVSRPLDWLPVADWLSRRALAGLAGCQAARLAWRQLAAAAK